MIFYEGHKVYMNGEYPAVFLNGKNAHIHRLQWQKYHGDIPDGFIVHHVDGNKLNWNIDNLVLMSRSDHIREHANVVHRKGIPILATKDGVIRLYQSIELAAKGCGTYTSSVRRVLIGKQKVANGWFFRKVGD